MPWSSPLTDPIVLKDGRVLVTFLDAADLFASFSESILEHDWISHAVALLIKAVEEGGDSANEAATRQVQRALFREGMI